APHVHWKSSGRATSLSPANPAQTAGPELHVSIEHALLAVGVVFRLAQSDELAEHEIVIGADAGGRSDDVAGSFDEIEPGIAVGMVAHLRMTPHAELPPGAKLRVGEQAGHAHHRISWDAGGL